MNPPCKHTPPKEAPLLYFAYGANLSQYTLKRRGVTPVAPPIPCRVLDPSIGLAFGHRAGYATLVSCNPDTTIKGIPRAPRAWQEQELSTCTTDPPLIYWQPHGALYHLTNEEFNKIKASEIGYSVGEIDVVPYGGVEVVRAIAFYSSPWLLLCRPVAPVERYRDLIVQGAYDNKLCSEYLEWLEHLPTVQPSALSSPEYSNTPTETAAKIMAIIAAVLITGAIIGIPPMFK